MHATSRNEFSLVGRIGNRVKYAKAQSGKTYVYFPVEIEGKDEYRNIIHVMCFKKKVVEYLQGVRAKCGNPVVVFGYASSYASEIKGEPILANGITATDIYIIKQKKDVNETKEESDGQPQN